MKRISTLAPIWIDGLDETPIGPLAVAVSESGLAEISFSAAAGLRARAADRLAAGAPPELLAEAVFQLKQYLSGHCRQFFLPLDFSGLTPFTRQVLQATLAISYGEVRTYGELARCVDRPNAARAVGAVMAANPIPLVIPCHRVLDSQYRLHGYSAGDGLETKAWLLRLEGHTIAGDRLGFN